jgi:NAD(P)-dependent dehydrogenase (short-subunit alcohol dehydrogenase family)
VSDQVQSQEFKGRVAFVTGGASGMGAATAHRLAAKGASVVVSDISDRGSQVAADIVAKGGEAVFQYVDVSDEASVRAGVARAIEEFGRLDLAANVAGIPQDPTPLAETELDLGTGFTGSTIVDSSSACVPRFLRCSRPVAGPS